MKLSAQLSAISDQLYSIRKATAFPSFAES